MQSPRTFFANTVLPAPMNAIFATGLPPAARAAGRTVAETPLLTEVPARAPNPRQQLLEQKEIVTWQKMR
jgi:hypothetical protein